VKGDDVVEDEGAESSEVKDVSEQDGSGDDGGVGVPAEAVDIAGDERDMVATRRGKVEAESEVATGSAGIHIRSSPPNDEEG
jgi:hypothetical protein